MPKGDCKSMQPSMILWLPSSSMSKSSYCSSSDEGGVLDDVEEEDLEDEVEGEREEAEGTEAGPG
jgi:hypothetical protein